MKPYYARYSYCYLWKRIGDRIAYRVHNWPTWWYVNNGTFTEKAE